MIKLNKYAYVLSVAVGLLVSVLLIVANEYSSKMDAKDREIKKLEMELSEYTVDEANILSCPFCGSDDVDFAGDSSQGYYILCNSCGAKGPKHNDCDPWSDEYLLTKAEAMEQWNNAQRQ